MEARVFFDGMRRRPGKFMALTAWRQRKSSQRTMVISGGQGCVCRDIEKTAGSQTAGFSRDREALTGGSHDLWSFHGNQAQIEMGLGKVK